MSVAADNGAENIIVFDSEKKYTFEAKAPEMLMKRKSWYFVYLNPHQFGDTSNFLLLNVVYVFMSYGQLC